MLCSYKAFRPTYWDQQLGSILPITLNDITVTEEKHVLTPLARVTGKIDRVLF